MNSWGFYVLYFSLIHDVARQESPMTPFIGVVVGVSS